MTDRELQISTNPLAIQFNVGGTFLLAVIYLAFYSRYSSFIQLPIIYFLPFYLLYAIGLIILTVIKSAAPIPWTGFLSGAVFIAGGPILDIVATLYHSPTLSREDNIIVHALFGSGFSVRFILTYGLLAQMELIVLNCLLWAGFLKHKETLLRLSNASGAKSKVEFIKAAMGGASLTWRQFLFPLKISELPVQYFLLWTVAAIILGGSIYRWYLAFEWFDLMRFNRNIVIVLSLLIPTTAYIFWLCNQYRKSPILASHE